MRTEDRYPHQCCFGSSAETRLFNEKFRRVAILCNLPNDKGHVSRIRRRPLQDIERLLMTLNAIRKNSEEENSFDYLMQSAAEPIDDLNTHRRSPCRVCHRLPLEEKLCTIAFSTLSDKIVRDGLN